MRAVLKWIYRIICVAVITVCALNPMVKAVFADKGMPGYAAVVFILLFILINFLPSLVNRSLIKGRHRVCADGAELLILFMISLTICIVLVIAGIAKHVGESSVSGRLGITAGTIASAVFILSVIFWNGIIRIYTTSVQLGIRHRVWGIILGWIFPVNLVMLGKMIKIVSGEVKTEDGRLRANAARRSEMICRTKYPILLVHGVFFRDFKQGFLNYWGRIPDELIANGATIYYGGQQSAASVAECGAELADCIRRIVAETGCEKVNIIGHSKGGLDSRYAIAKCGIADMVASLTTVNTPHRGCEFADYLLEKIPEGVKNHVASTYNAALLRLGDHDPDFLKAVYDLTHSSCARFNEEVEDVPGVYYQSFGSCMKKAGGGRFPLNYSFHLVKFFDGPNDGLVGEASFKWGENYVFLTPPGNRGISHGDMIDLNRENIPGFDVREFYIQVVNDLKNRGF